MTDANSAEWLRRRMSEFRYWYHKIELAPGVVTPGFALDALWDHLRQVRGSVDYRDKVVLDLASFDGLFAFEAERLGARLVVATDCQFRSFSNFLFCREALRSRVVPYYNVSPYNLVDRLDVYFDERFPDNRDEDRRFDIVQHFGLLYHLRDPLLSLSQARSVLKPGGKLVIETDVVMECNDSFLVSNGLPHASRVRDNYSVWWAPTRVCLFEMLESALFQVHEDTYSEFLFEPPATDAGRISTARRGSVERGGSTYKIGRGAVIASAIDLNTANPKLADELSRTYRNPGLDMRLVNWR